MRSDRFNNVFSFTLGCNVSRCKYQRSLNTLAKVVSSPRSGSSVFSLMVVSRLCEYSIQKQVKKAYFLLIIEINILVNYCEFVWILPKQFQLQTWVKILYDISDQSASWMISFYNSFVMMQTDEYVRVLSNYACICYTLPFLYDSRRSASSEFLHVKSNSTAMG